VNAKNCKNIKLFDVGSIEKEINPIHKNQ